MIPAHWRYPFASPFPNATQRQVVTAIFAPDAVARTAFNTWRATLNLEGRFDSEILRLLPLLYVRLCELGIEDDLMPRLKGVYRQAWVRNIELLQATRTAVAALERAGVPTLVLKGAPLALVFYPKPAARPMADLDVAVPKERLAEAIRVLAAANWTSPRINLGALSVSHAAVFRSAGGHELDLHWHVLMETSGKPVEARFWETARPLDLDGVPTRMLDPALALVHVLVHGLRTNRVPPVRWVADALTIIRRSVDLDWDLLVAFARAAKVTQRMRVGLAFVTRGFDAPVPAETLKALAMSRPSLMERAETAAVLFETRGLAGNAITKPIILLTDYIRQADECGLQRVPGFLHYVHRRLSVSSALSAQLRNAVRPPEGTPEAKSS